MANNAMAGKTDAEWNPPARFDHAYAGKLTIIRLPQKQVSKACIKMYSQYGIKGTYDPNRHGCAYLQGDSCTVIIMNKKFMGATPKAVLRHEIGHCNSWPGDHPD